MTNNELFHKTIAIAERSESSRVKSQQLTLAIQLLDRLEVKFTNMELVRKQLTEKEAKHRAIWMSQPLP